MFKKTSRDDGGVFRQLNISVSEESYNFIKAAAERIEISMGGLIDVWASYHKKKKEVRK